MQHRFLLTGYLVTLFASNHNCIVPTKVHQFFIVPFWFCSWIIAHYSLLDFTPPPLFSLGLATCALSAYDYSGQHALLFNLRKALNDLDAERKLLLSTQVALYGMLSSLFDASCVCNRGGMIEKYTPQFQDLLARNEELRGQYLQSFGIADADEVRLQDFLHQAIIYINNIYQ